jgi:hypothetical protein
VFDYGKKGKVAEQVFAVTCGIVFIIRGKPLAREFGLRMRL